MLRTSADSEGNIDRYTVESITYGEDNKPNSKPKSVKISNDTYTKYFAEGTKLQRLLRKHLHITLPIAIGRIKVVAYE